jgi:uncharacterized protein
MTNKFLAGLMALAFCFITALSAHAQDAPTQEKQALIKEFMKLTTTSTNSEAVVDQFLGQGLKQSAPMISQALLTGVPQEKLSPDEQKRLKTEADEATQRILVHVRAEFPKRVNLAELFDRVGVEVYAKYFTDEEIKELITLYKSPAAQKFLRLLPQFTSEILPKMQEWITPALTQLMDEAFTEEKKKFNAK